VIGGVTHFAFAIAKAARVKLVVEDVAGRRVATLIDQSLTAGNHEVLWEGRVDDGKEAAAGVYFYRLIVDGKTSQARRLVVQ